jgi:hypothetical protein
MQPVRRSDVCCAAALVAAVACLWAPRLDGPIDLRWDAGVYYVLGTSIAEGRGYRLLYEPGAIEEVHYPPLLPAGIALVQRALGTSDAVRVGEVLRVASAGLCAALALATYGLARLFLPPLPALLGALVAALHHETYFLSDLAFTEVPYALVSVLFVLVARTGSLVGAGALGAAAVLLRSPGVALLGAWVGDAVLKRTLAPAAARAVLAAVPVLIWGVHVARVTSSAGYPGVYPYQRAPYQYYNVTYAENLALADTFRPEGGRLSPWRLAARVAANVLEAPQRLGDAASAPRMMWTDAAHRASRAAGGARGILFAADAARLAVGATILGGLVLLALAGEWIVPLHVAFTYLLVSVTPWPAQLPRYLSPLAPFVAVALALALWRLAGGPPGAGRRARRLVVVGVAALVAGSQAYAIAVAFGRNHREVIVSDAAGSRATARLFYYDERWARLDAALEWLGPRSAPGDVIATSAPQTAFLRTGRRAVMLPMEADAAVAQRLLDSVPVAYVVIDDLDPDVARRYGEPAVTAFPSAWELVFDQGARIYRRRLVGLGERP